MVTPETCLCVVAFVEQETHHHLVSQAVLQGSGKHGVTDHCEVAVDVCPFVKQHLDNLVKPCSHCHQKAVQRVQVRLGTGVQQHLSASHVPIGDSKIQRAFSQICVVLRVARVHAGIDVEVVGDEELQTFAVTSIGRRVNRTLAGLFQRLFGGEWYQYVQDTVDERIRRLVEQFYR